MIIYVYIYIVWDDLTTWNQSFYLGFDWVFWIVGKRLPHLEVGLYISIYNNTRKSFPSRQL